MAFTLSKTLTGKYFIGVFVDDGKELPEKPKFDDSTTVGIDVGIKDFAVLSTYEKYNYLKASEDFSSFRILFYPAGLSGLPF
ncbi:Mobile element protein [Methanosarcina sp. WWM596]|nr:Mobile element protein [Methanosarcina sp. WWM596]AKB20412.1 Mobile element protein [Methanosarcina sp. WH1]